MHMHCIYTCMHLYFFTISISGALPTGRFLEYALLAGWNFSFDFLFHPEKSLLGVIFCLERYLLVICQNNSKENPHFLSFHLLFSFIQSRVCWEWWRHLAATRPSQLPNYFQWKLALFRLWKKLCCLWKKLFVFEKLFRLWKNESIAVCQITFNKD